MIIFLIWYAVIFVLMVLAYYEHGSEKSDMAIIDQYHKEFTQAKYDYRHPVWRSFDLFLYSRGV